MLHICILTFFNNPVCHYITQAGRVYIADGCNERLVILDGSTGHVLQMALQEKIGRFWHVAWNAHLVQVFVCHSIGSSHVSSYRVRVTYYYMSIS